MLFFRWKLQKKNQLVDFTMLKFNKIMSMHKHNNLYFLYFLLTFQPTTVTTVCHEDLVTVIHSNGSRRTFTIPPPKWQTLIAG